ncbi:MAG TPA: hypothetical protein VFS07_02370 [Gemmatimonadales bacterium]|nr:hypothetical protein [Gemmatimonadales bacterium]
MPRRAFLVAGILSALILLAKLAFPVAALGDPSGAPLPAGLHLAFPALAIALAPLFDLWDGITMLSQERLTAVLYGVPVAYLAYRVARLALTRRWDGRRGLVAPLCFVACYALFLLAGVRWRRPMAHLAGVPDTLLVADLHSHTNVSHDVKGPLQGGFDLAASRAWHARGGFDLFFVADHNRIDGWQGRLAGRAAPVACPGEEMSLYGAHIVLLGNVDSVPRGGYADSLPGILRLLGESESRWGALTLASIPEYDANHFARLPEWIAAGLDGLEVSNPAPRANRQTAAHVDSVIHLARTTGRWVAGVTDQHGMGATVQAWTLVPREAPPPGDSADAGTPPLCRAVLHTLATRGFAATQVVERHRVRADARWPRLLTLVAVPWEGWRAAGWAQVTSWLAWTWGIALLAAARRRVRG